MYGCKLRLSLDLLRLLKNALLKENLTGMSGSSAKECPEQVSMALTK